MEKAIKYIKPHETSTQAFKNIDLGGIYRKENVDKAIEIAYLEGKLEHMEEGEDRIAAQDKLNALLA